MKSVYEGELISTVLSCKTKFSLDSDNTSIFFIQQTIHCITESLLSQFSKILEKLFSKRLLSFVSDYNIITNSQYGFKVETSTSHALDDATNYIWSSLDNNYFTIGIFADLKRAYYIVDHTILLKNRLLWRTGVSNDFLRSYLSHRSQFFTTI